MWGATQRQKGAMDVAAIAGRRRVVIEGLAPEVDAGRFPIKRAVGETVAVEADAFADGHDVIRVALHHRSARAADWHVVPMVPLPNDRWRAAFRPDAVGTWVYLVRAWVDDFGTWRRGLHKKVAAGQDVSVDLLIGAGLVERHAPLARGPDQETLRALAARLADPEATDRVEVALSAGLQALIDAAPDLRFAATSGERLVVVDPPRAVFSSWYELFPRSAGAPGRHGTLQDV
jgi:starch synthase (maltosyl-transferring)